MEHLLLQAYLEHYAWRRDEIKTNKKNYILWLLLIHTLAIEAPLRQKGKTLELDTDHTYNNKNSEYKQPKQIEPALVTY